MTEDRGIGGSGHRDQHGAGNGAGGVAGGELVHQGCDGRCPVARAGRVGEIATFPAAWG